MLTSNNNRAQPFINFIRIVLCSLVITIYHINHVMSIYLCLSCKSCHLFVSVIYINHIMSIHFCQSCNSSHVCSTIIIIAAITPSYTYFPHNHKDILNNTYHISDIMLISCHINHVTLSYSFSIMPHCHIHSSSGRSCEQYSFLLRR